MKPKWNNYVTASFRKFIRSEGKNFKIPIKFQLSLHSLPLSPLHPYPLLNWNNNVILHPLESTQGWVKRILKFQSYSPFPPSPPPPPPQLWWNCFLRCDLPFNFCWWERLHIFIQHHTTKNPSSDLHNNVTGWTVRI